MTDESASMVTGAGTAHNRTDRGSRSKGAVGRAESTLDDYPLAVLVGGIAVGALAGAALPRTQRETEMFGDIGRRLNDSAVAAAKAARDAGKQELHDAGISRDAAREQVKGLFDGLVQAAGSAGEAAAKAAVDKV